MNSLGKYDCVVFLVYFLTVALYGWTVYRKKQAQKGNSKDFFLAKDSLNLVGK